jgi:hypothetical protein
VLRWAHYIIASIKDYLPTEIRPRQLWDLWGCSPLETFRDNQKMILLLHRLATSS